MRKKYGYIVWGVNDKTKCVVGTNVSFDRDFDGEPYKHYLSRKLNPSIPFETKEISYQGNNVLLLVIPAAKNVKTTYERIPYIRIGSSKEKLEKYPEWEIKLNNTLQNGFPQLLILPLLIMLRTCLLENSLCIMVLRELL